MSPQTYKAARKKLGLTQAQLAALLDVSRKAIVDREREGAKISKEAGLALQALLRTPVTHDTISKLPQIRPRNATF